ncbi:metallophosphoesterase family protein [Aspergillus clavatus NRRL 1]|uniref:Ser/Thr protein phosphatase family protein n=1 Tax=Aspergillus clavatus (strain ATCC 1007 / CBS 513.65 / DSM 816 / NCTC 3887 / NRRL 1 / QM 1276 / 107) TaxID=344612 RepID=A1CTE2_ASPCL|nr:Ser/Thr protein phosphatase family protein [Aspergillus clavatus NRRL 1]EAW06579.1 Ser/Thr protein phosphatase family protein [Aspergillus clavatus NRRL 1]
MTATKAPDRIFPISTFISDLPINLIPQSLRSSSEHDPGKRRLVIVGDVHGMSKSLQALLDKVAFDQSNGDHLILVGDLFNKGPDSPGVVDLAIKLGASAVRGNHDNAVLDAAAEIKASGGSLLPSEADVPGDIARGRQIPGKCASATAGSGMRHSATTYSTARALSTDRLDWLAALPLIVRVKLKLPPSPTSPFGDTLVVVHAGLVPGIPLEEQDPHAIMHLRSLVRAPDDAAGFIPAETSGEESWVQEWDRWQEKQASKTTVIFGHDAKRRLQLGRYAIGLDSACLYGHQLSAIVIMATDRGIEHQIVQIECADEPVVPKEPVKEDDQTMVV